MSNAQQPLTAAEKLALSRQALHAALYPPPASKKTGVVGSLRRLWPAGRKAKQAMDVVASRAVQVAASAPKPLTDVVSRANARAVREQSAVVDADARANQQAGSLLHALSGAFGRVGDLLGTVLQARWSKHPAHFALQVGEPLLQAQIRKRPIPWLAGAVAAGAAFVLLNPLKWKQSRRLAGSVLGKEVRVLATSGLVFLGASVLRELLSRAYREEK